MPSVVRPSKIPWAADDSCGEAPRERIGPGRAEMLRINSTPFVQLMRIFSMDRQAHGRRRAPPFLAADGQFPLVKFGDLARDGHPQPRTFFLGRVKRLEQPPQRFRVHPLAVINDLDDHLAVSVRACTQLDAAARLARFNSIYYQIQEKLLQLRRVELAARQVGGELPFD